MIFTPASVDEVRKALGTPLGPTDWLDIDQARIDAFAEATGDHQWIHVDAERAATGPFGRTIAHGFLTLSLIPMFSAQLFVLEFGTARLNYGLNRVRLPAPVPVGSRIRAVAEFCALTEVAAGQLLTTHYTIEVDGAAKPACSAEMLTLVVTR